MPDGKEIEIQDGMILGRVKGCHVVVADSKASRRHARLVSQGGVVEIEDLDSSNGTRLNGKDISRRMLRDGDVIQIGATSLAFSEREAAPEVGPSDFAGGDDLFGDEEPATPPSPPAASPPAASSPAAPPPATPPPPAAPPPKEPEPAMEVEVRQAQDTPSAPSPGDEVLEFADDDVVGVKRSLPEPGKKARVTPAQAASKAREGGVLQFHSVEDKGGFFGHDLSQMSTVQRMLMFVLALVVAGALFYAALYFTSSL